MAVVGFQLHYI